MEKKILKKRKGQWITTSVAVLTIASIAGGTLVNAQSATYVVQPNDGLYRIAVNHGMTMEQLKQLNGLSSNFIYPGQVLKVTGSSTPIETTVAPKPVAPTVAPKPVETTVAPTPTASGTYTVKKGDYLYKIATQYGMTVDQLRKLNGLTSNILTTGQVLKVSVTTSNPTPTPKPVETTVAPKPAPTTSGTYTVKSGDYLYKIATQYGMTVDQLRKLNGLTSNLIYSGQVLKVSGTTSNPTPTPKPVETTVAPKPAPKPAPTTSGTYTVKKGDYLYKIATQYGMTVDQLRKLNGLTSNLIYSGQVLKVSGTTTTPTPKPVETTVAPKPKPVETTVAPTTSGTYTVKKGDYLYKIATQYGMTVDQLRKLNGLTSNLLYSGQVLKVSGTTTTPTPKPVETTVAPKPKPVETTVAPKPAPTTVAPKPAPTTSGTYTVKSGDYLYKIATQYGMTVDQLRKLNGLTSNLIYSGQVLKVSGGTTSVPTPKPVETTVAPKPVTTPTGDFAGTTVKNVMYTVAKGDTLESIAKEFGVSTQSITSVNGSNIYVGKSIKIPNAVVKPMNISQSYDGKRTVWLDAGHGGSEPGTYAADKVTKESNLNLNLDNKLTKKLEEKGYVVRRTRTSDVNVDFVTERSRRANASDADIFVSLHHNAMPSPSATGIVSFYYENNTDYVPKINETYHNDPSRVANSAHLTNLIHRNLINMDHNYYPTNPARDHGVQTGTYAVLRETAIPATLLEFGFIDTWSDFNKARNTGYQDGIVNAVASGIDEYFNTVFSKK